MFGWLFGFKSMPVVLPNETRFSDIPVGKEFKKTGEEIAYVKVAKDEFETIGNGCRCTKWYRVNEDFMVKV